MTLMAPAVVYSLCLATSTLCAGLLLRAFLRSRSRLLLFNAMGFGCLALNNLFLVADTVLFPEMDLLPLRQAANLAAVAVLLYGFTFEARS